MYLRSLYNDVLYHVNVVAAARVKEVGEKEREGEREEIAGF